MISANTARDYARNSRIPYYVIPKPLWGISIGNSRALVIASEAKQSLGILDLVLGILDFLGVRGCLFFGILEFLVIFA